MFLCGFVSVVDFVLLENFVRILKIIGSDISASMCWEK